MIPATEHHRLPIGLGEVGSRNRDVFLRPMTGIEEKILSSPRYAQNSAGAITAVLQNCILEITGKVPRKSDPYKPIPVDAVRSMFQSDRDYLMLAIRVLTYGPDMRMEWTCDKRSCRAENEERIDLTELDIREWPEDHEPHLEFELPFGIDIRGTRYRQGLIRFSTGKDAEPLGRLAHDPGAMASAMLAATISLLPQRDEDRDVVRIDTTQADRMVSPDRLHLMKMVRKQFPGVIQERDLTCGACGKLHPGRDLDLAFFFEGSASV